MIMSRTKGEEKTKWESTGKGEKIGRKERKKEGKLYREGWFAVQTLLFKTLFSNTYAMSIH
jgi:hypothetical protein